MLATCFLKYLIERLEKLLRFKLDIYLCKGRKGQSFYERLVVFCKGLIS